MAFCLVIGTNDFQGQMKSAPPNFTTRCQNCGNFTARPTTRWPWVTICFIPLIPLSFHKYEELTCPVCNFHQDLRDRPDIKGQIESGAVPQQPHTGGGGGGNQGWGAGGGQEYPMQNYQGSGGQVYGGQHGGKPQYG